MYKWTKCYKGPHVHIQTYVDRVKMTFCLHVLKSHCRTLKHYCQTQVITHHQPIIAWIYITLSMLPTECKWSDRSTCLHTIIGCENCNDVGRDLWPHINITLEHYDKRTFGMVISWDKPGSFVHCWEVCCSMTNYGTTVLYSQIMWQGMYWRWEVRKRVGIVEEETWLSSDAIVAALTSLTL